MRIKTVLRKIKEKSTDSYYIFRNTNRLRGMIAARDMALYQRSEEDRNLILIAFYPTGGFGDGIISSKLLDELYLYGPCRIDVFCNNMTFGKAVFSQRPGVRVLPYDAYEHSKYLYDIALTVEHFVHVDHYNSRHVAKLSPILADKIKELGASMSLVRPDIPQQWFREAMHFRRCELKGINRYTELSHEKVFHIKDQRTAVYLEENSLNRLEELGIRNRRYVTINRGADSMGRSGMQTKVWPEEYYIEFVKLFKEKYPDIEVVQIGSKSDTKIKGADRYILGESLEVIKWILKYSIFHLDCEGGLVHLATQLSTKCVVVFGPTPYHFYSYPQNINIVSEACNNCMGTHADWAFSCYRGLSRPECMYSITAEMVMERVNEYMASANDKKPEVVSVTHDGKERNDAAIALEEELSVLAKNKDFVRYNKDDILYYHSIMEKLETIPTEKRNVVILNAGRDILPWYLTKRNYTVTIIDKDFGWSGKKSDVSHCHYMQKCVQSGIEVRFGNEYCIPLDDGNYDILIILSHKALNGYEREAKRVVNEEGTIILG